MKNYPKNFGSPKNLLVKTKQSFLLAKKHISFHIWVKLNAFNIKLKSIISEVIQRLCATFGANWNIGGAIFAYNVHILNNTFANLISICSLNRAGFSDIGHTHFCCTFRSLKRHICKTYFFELLLWNLFNLHETCHVHSSAKVIKRILLGQKICNLLTN